MAIAIAAALFTLIAASILWYGYRSYVNPVEKLEQISAPLPGAGPRSHEPAGGKEAVGYKVTTFLQFVGEKMPHDPQASSMLRRQLMSAGFRSDNAIYVFIAIRAALSIIFFVTGVSLAFLTQFPMLIRYAIGGGCAVLGFILANFGLDVLGDFYREKLRLSLPDALDLLIVCVEAGLGLDQAIRKVSDELMITHPELCREFNMMSLEMRAGVKRTDAMRNMADRTNEPELRKFTAVMIQTDRFGTSVAESLRAHSEFMRMKRRQTAEEKANKLGVKMILPVFFFILPAILIIAAGPAVIRIFRIMLPLMASDGS